MSGTLSSVELIARPLTDACDRPAGFRGRRVLVAGDGDAAFTAALALLPFACAVTLVTGAVVRAGSAEASAIRAASTALLLDLVRGVPIDVDLERGRLVAVHLLTASGRVRLAADDLVGTHGVGAETAPHLHLPER